MTDTEKAVIELSANALKVLQRRYLKKGDNGEQSVLRALIRVGNEIADAIKDARGFTVDKRKVLLEEPIVEAVKDGRGQVLALNNEDYFNPVFVLAVTVHRSLPS